MSILRSSPALLQMLHLLQSRLPLRLPRDHRRTRLGQNLCQLLRLLQTQSLQRRHGWIWGLCRQSRQIPRSPSQAVLDLSSSKFALVFLHPSAILNVYEGSFLHKLVFSSQDEETLNVFILLRKLRDNVHWKSRRRLHWRSQRHLPNHQGDERERNTNSSHCKMRFYSRGKGRNDIERLIIRVMYYAAATT